MVHPLVHDKEGAFQLLQVGNGVLGQHGNPIGINQFWDAVVDFRVDVVRPAGKDNAPAPGFFHI